MENEVKQRNQRNRRRERAQRMQAQRESKVKDGDSGEDESPAREKPPRPPARRKKSKEPLGEEDIIDGFAIMAFRTYEDLEASRFCLVVARLYYKPKQVPLLLFNSPHAVFNVYAIFAYNGKDELLRFGATTECLSPTHPVTHPLLVFPGV
ncbi:unnamed protein product [Euphydryas editha]|uniref:Uncharacterized protein n=1 Tax=Euphydryas editha TaxID=104508 RepID=A0AAU9UEU4_EUPED|nr:unnamed protein product [Euphydryas editha]